VLDRTPTCDEQTDIHRAMASTAVKNHSTCTCSYILLSKAGKRQLNLAAETKPKTDTLKISCMESVELVLSEEDSLWWEWFVKLVGIEQGVK